MNAPEVAALFLPPSRALGVVHGMSFNDYRAVEALSQSGARKILRSPLHYKIDRDQPSEPTAAMRFGSAVHCGVLEPDDFDARVCCAPKVDRRTTVGKAEWADFLALSNGKAVLDADEYARARGCVEAVRAHPSAKRLLENAQTEVSIFWTDQHFKVPCKARLDARNPQRIIVDLKTTQDASPEAFAKSIANFGYTLQAAHYFSGAEHVLDETPQAFVIIAVESEPPHAVACYQMPSNGILAGAHQMDIALERYARALETGTFCGYPETIESIRLPRWATTFDL